MGFLNGLVNGMLRESTGYDVRKITRLVGGKNILMLGAGAALAGGMAGTLGGAQGASSGPSSWDAPRGPAPAPRGPAAAATQPPPPPLPGQAAAPPPSLPPMPPPGSVPAAAAGVEVAGEIPAGEIPAADPAVEVELPQELTYGIVRAMVAAALSDGHLDDEEKKTVLDRLQDSGLSPEQTQQVHRDLVIPPTPSELAALSEQQAHREAMYRFAGLLILADGSVSDLERSWLDRLAAAFGFDAARKSALEAEIFE